MNNPSSILKSLSAKGLIVFLLLILFSFAQTSCRAKRLRKKAEAEAAQNPPVIDTTAEACPHLIYKTAKNLSKNLKENEFNFEWVNAKFNCELTVDNEESTFNISLRCRKDSAIWLSASKLGIEGMRCLITKDSVKMILTLNEKKYFKGDYAYVNQLLNADLDFDMVQALLFGNSTAFYDEDEKLKPGKDKKNCQYFLSTVRKRHVKRIVNGQEQPKDAYQTIWLDPVNFKITTLEFEDVETKRMFNACYDDFKQVDKYLSPFHLLYTVTAQKIIKADIRYSKINMNEPQKFPFNIPANYEPIQIKK